MYKATCTKNGQLVTELSAPTIPEIAQKVDQWIHENNNEPVSCNIFEDFNDE